MPIDIENERLLTFAQAVDWIETLTGSRPGRASVWRWVHAGIKGRKLEYVMLGGIARTSAEALQRFATAHEPPPEKVAISKRRQKEIEAASKRAKEIFG